MNSNNLRAGFSRISITPDVDQQTVFGLGYWYERAVRFVSVRDPIYVRSAWIEVDGQSSLVVSVDSIFDSYGFSESAVDSITDRLGVERDNIFISCTHTHSTPLIGLNNTQEGAEYGDFVTERIVHSAVDARAAAAKANVRTTAGRAETVIHNRRPVRQDGVVAELMADCDPADIADWGPLNDTMTVVHFEDAAGMRLGTFCHFGIHGICVQTKDSISGDCMGRAMQRWEARYDSVFLHLNGPCGDTNPVAFGDDEALAQVENALVENGTPVIEQDGQSVDCSTVCGHRAAIELGRRTTRAQDAIEAERTALTTEHEDDGESLHSGAGFDLLLLSEEEKVGGMPERFNVSWQVLRLGDILLVGVGAEIFTCFGDRLRQLSDRVTILPVGITHGWMGYLPPQEAYAQGGYETANARWCIAAPGEAERFYAGVEREVKKVLAE